MTLRILTITAVVGAALVLAVPVAWGSGQPYRDTGDATAARLAFQSPSTTFPGEGLATGSEIHWAQLGIGFAVGLFLVLGVILAVRVTRSHRLAH